MSSDSSDGLHRSSAGGLAHGFALADRRRKRQAQGLHRTLTPASRVGDRSRFAPDPAGDEPVFGETELVFAANNYLGLTDHPRVQEAAETAARAVGTGAGASRLVTGDTRTHRALERDLADAKGTERALVFSSGYAANVGTITALEPDVVFSDELNHASIVDGVRLADADVVTYDHCDPADLGARFRRRAERGEPGETWLVVTDSVFSMDGTVAPLAAICDAAERHGAWVMVDEAHATGLYEDGGGIVQREGLGDRVQIQLGTLSKALAAQGGYVAGSENLIDHLVNTARSFVFSTGLNPPAAAAAREALALAQESDRRERLWRNVHRLRDGLESLGYDVWGETQVLPVVVGDRGDALGLAEAVRSRNVVAPAIRPPTVPDGTSRIRLAPMATHSNVDIDRCIAAFAAARQEVCP